MNQRHPSEKRIPTEFYRQMHPTIFQQKVQPKTPQTSPHKTFNLSLSGLHFPPHRKRTSPVHKNPLARLEVKV